MTYRMADACPSPDSNAVLEADLRSLGARAMGLYVVNLSLPECERGAGYVQALVADGVGVLPIIVPGDTPPQNLDLLGALRTWGVPPAPVAFDLEGGSQPPFEWVVGKVSELKQAGYSPAPYGSQGYQSIYWTAGWDWHWLADWTYVEGLTPGYQAQQWTNQAVAFSGTRYDLSLVEDSIALWGMAAFQPPLLAGDVLPAELSFPAVLVGPAAL